MIQAYFNIFAIFAMMFVGYFLSYKKWFDRYTADTFSKMVLGLALPFEMFITITQKFSRADFVHGTCLFRLESASATFKR